MNNTITFRKLRPEEIELRVGATTESGFSLLLYKTARVDANILDETVGAYNWTKRFYQVKNTMICAVAIYFADRNEWVEKGDAGDESNTEAIKGEASDSFKRAGFAWGIGRELYTSPFVWIKKDQDNDPKKSHYEVKEIEYKDNEISKLVIVNEKTGQVVFSKGSATKVSQTSQKAPQKGSVEDITQGLADEFGIEEEKISGDDLTFLQAYVGNLGGEKYTQFFTWLKNKYGVKNIVELTKEQGRKICYYLKNK